MSTIIFPIEIATKSGLDIPFFRTNSIHIVGYIQYISILNPQCFIRIPGPNILQHAPDDGLVPCSQWIQSKTNMIFRSQNVICKWFVLHGLPYLCWVLWRMTLLFVILKSINVGTVQTNVNSKAPREHQGESSLERLEKHLTGSRQPLSTNQPCVDEVT